MSTAAGEHRIAVRRRKSDSNVLRPAARTLHTIELRRPRSDTVIGLRVGCGAEGTTVKTVEPGSLAEAAGLRPGMHLQSIAGRAVHTTDGVYAAFQAAPVGRPFQLVVAVEHKAPQRETGSSQGSAAEAGGLQRAHSGSSLGQQRGRPGGHLAQQRSRSSGSLSQLRMENGLGEQREEAERLVRQRSRLSEAHRRASHTARVSTKPAGEAHADPAPRRRPSVAPLEVAAAEAAAALDPKLFTPTAARNIACELGHLRRKSIVSASEGLTSSNSASALRSAVSRQGSGTTLKQALSFSGSSVPRRGGSGTTLRSAPLTPRQRPLDAHEEAHQRAEAERSKALACGYRVGARVVLVADAAGRRKGTAGFVVSARQDADGAVLVRLRWLDGCGTAEVPTDRITVDSQSAGAPRRSDPAAVDDTRSCGSVASRPSRRSRVSRASRCSSAASARSYGSQRSQGSARSLGELRGILGRIHRDRETGNEARGVLAGVVLSDKQLQGQAIWQPVSAAEKLRCRPEDLQKALSAQLEQRDRATMSKHRERDRLDALRLKRLRRRAVLAAKMAKIAAQARMSMAELQEVSWLQQAGLPLVDTEKHPCKEGESEEAYYQRLVAEELSRETREIKPGETIIVQGRSRRERAATSPQRESAEGSDRSSAQDSEDELSPDSTPSAAEGHGRSEAAISARIRRELLSSMQAVAAGEEDAAEEEESEETESADEDGSLARAKELCKRNVRELVREYPRFGKTFNSYNKETQAWLDYTMSQGMQSTVDEIRKLVRKGEFDSAEPARGPEHEATLIRDTPDQVLGLAWENLPDQGGVRLKLVQAGSLAARNGMGDFVGRECYEVCQTPVTCRKDFQQAVCERRIVFMRFRPPQQGQAKPAAPVPVARPAPTPPSVSVSSTAGSATRSTPVSAPATSRGAAGAQQAEQSSESRSSASSPGGVEAPRGTDVIGMGDLSTPLSGGGSTPFSPQCTNAARSRGDGSLAERVARIYAAYEPAKAANAAELAQKYQAKGQGEELIAMLVQRYGPEPAAPQPAMSEAEARQRLFAQPEEWRVKAAKRAGKASWAGLTWLQRLRLAEAAGAEQAEAAASAPVTAAAQPPPQQQQPDSYPSLATPTSRHADVPVSPPAAARPAPSYTVSPPTVPPPTPLGDPSAAATGTPAGAAPGSETELRVGCRVMAHLLQSCPQLNGKEGKVTCCTGERWGVKFDDPELGSKALRAANLVVLPDGRMSPMQLLPRRK